jgi:hypothetical protein
MDVTNVCILGACGFSIVAIIYALLCRAWCKSLEHQIGVLSFMISENDKKKMLYADVEVAVKNQLESVRLVVGTHVGSAGNSETNAKKHDPYRSPNFSCSGVSPETFDRMKISTKVSG